MSQHPLDDPKITSNLFFPISARPGTSRIPNTQDGTIPLPDGEKLGYRFYVHTADSPILLFFHGNGETAALYDGMAPLYHNTGVSLLVVDYRGYGWSTGVPLTTRLLPDARIALDHLTTVFETVGLDKNPLFVKGRSLGSASAIYLAHEEGDRFKGLILESGYADAPSLFRRLGIPIPKHMTDDVTLPINNVGKIARVNLPMLVIHGEQDTLIPVEHGKKLYQTSPSEQKSLLTIAGAGHNNLLAYSEKRYFDAITHFVKTHKSP